MQYLGSNVYRVWLSNGSFIDMSKEDLEMIQDLEFIGSKVEELEEKIVEFEDKIKYFSEECDDFIDNIQGFRDAGEDFFEEFSEEIIRFKAVLDEFRPKKRLILTTFDYRATTAETP